MEDRASAECFYPDILLRSRYYWNGITGMAGHDFGHFRGMV
jgi:hypothetical protein